MNDKEKFIQTFHPNLFLLLFNKDYQQYSQLLQQRQAMQPPYQYCALIQADHQHADKAEHFYAPSNNSVNYQLPAASALFRHT